MKNRGSTLISTFLVGIYLRNIHTYFEADTCSGLKEVKKAKKITKTTTTDTE